jgi:hypothetical protein
VTLDSSATDIAAACGFAGDADATHQGLTIEGGAGATAQFGTGDTDYHFAGTTQPASEGTTEVSATYGGALQNPRLALIGMVIREGRRGVDIIEPATNSQLVNNATSVTTTASSAGTERYTLVFVGSSNDYADTVSYGTTDISANVVAEAIDPEGEHVRVYAMPDPPIANRAVTATWENAQAAAHLAVFAARSEDSPIFPAGAATDSARHTPVPITLTPSTAKDLLIGYSFGHDNLSSDAGEYLDVTHPYRRLTARTTSQSGSTNYSTVGTWVEGFEGSTQLPFTIHGNTLSDISYTVAGVRLTNLDLDNNHTLTYTAGPGGTLLGLASQRVNNDASGRPVTAIGSGGNAFVRWSDGSTDNPRTDGPGTENVNVTAQFGFPLTYTAGDHGSISGTAAQVVPAGEDGSTVQAVPETGYHFAQWSDGSTNNPRTDTDVTAALSVTANFVANTPGQALAIEDVVDGLSFKVNGGSGTVDLTAYVLHRGGQDGGGLGEVDSALVFDEASGEYRFVASRTGRYEFTFTDGGGTGSGEEITKTFDVEPYLAFTAERQPGNLGAATAATLWLSDLPIDYPVQVDFDATGLDVGDASPLTLTETDGLRKTVALTPSGDAAAEHRIDLLAAGIDNALLGSPARHTVAIQSAATPLPVTLEATPAQTVAAGAGPLTLQVTPSGAGYVLDWSASDDGLGIDGATNGNPSIDPSALDPGLYQARVTVTESGTGLVGQARLALRVVDACPAGGCLFDDGTIRKDSGVPPAEDAYADQPARLAICPPLDDMSDNRIAACRDADGESPPYMEVAAGYALRLGEQSGDESWSSGQFGLGVVPPADAGHTQLGFPVDFEITGLEIPGSSTAVVLPLPAGSSLPGGAAWRKYGAGAWRDFVVDDANRLESAAREASGACPGVSAPGWEAGLLAGRGCVRLVIQDGGPNDLDGAADGAIDDPGVLATVASDDDDDDDSGSGGGGHGGGSADVFLLLLGLAGLARRFIPRGRRTG